MAHTQVYLIRHGETDWNHQGIMQGHLDIELNDKGHIQAQSLAEHLPRHDYHAIYSSDLQRAKVTANYLAKPLGLSVRTETSLRERNLGILQGLTKAQANQQHPEVTQRYPLEMDFVIPEGESSEQFMQRAVTGLTGVARQHPGENIIVVSHGGFLGNILKHTLGIPLSQPRRFAALNTAWNWFVYDTNDNSWQLNTWGDVQHLHKASSLDDADS